MKKLLSLLLLILIGCSEPEPVNFEQLIIRDSLYYLDNSNKVFDGPIFNINGKSDGFIKEGKWNGEFKFYYSNGELKGTGSYKDGDGSDLGDTGISKNGREGLWKFYYDNGQLKGTGSYKDGKIDGPFKFYYQNGQLQTEENWKDSQIILVKKYQENGKIISEQTFKDGKPDGPFKYYYKNGQLKEKGIIVEGKLDGLFTSYFDNGQITSEQTFKDGKLDGFQRFYYANGSIEKEGWVESVNEDFYDELDKGELYKNIPVFYYYDGNERSLYLVYDNVWHKKINLWTYVNKDNEIEKHTYSDDDFYNIHIEHLDSNKKIFSEGNLTQVAGYNIEYEKNKQWKYYDNGTLKRIVNYSSPSSIKTIERFLPNGNLLTKEEYDCESYSYKVYESEAYRCKSGLQVYYDFDGTYLGEINLKANKITDDSKSKFFSISGTYVQYNNFKSIKKIQKYKYGKLYGTSIENYNNGNIKEESNYFRDYKSGPQKTYFSNGQLKTERFYVLSEERDNNPELQSYITGPFKEYWSNGQLKEQGVIVGDFKSREFRVKDHKYKSLYEIGKIHPYVSYYENGILKEKGNHKVFDYIDGSYTQYAVSVVKDGNWKSYFDNGNLELSINYVSEYDGRWMNYQYVDGPFEKYWPNGNLKRSGQYENSKLQGRSPPYTPGLVTIFYENGNKQEETFYRKGDSLSGFNVSVWSKKYYENGTLKEHSFPPEKLKSSNERPIGYSVNNRIEYFESGEISYSYIANKLITRENGLEIIEFEEKKYWPNGNIASSGFKNGGENSGVWITYNKNGVMIKKITLEQNYMNEQRGPFETYHENGNLKLQGRYGSSKCYNQNFDGWVKEFNVEGKLIRELLYDCGEIIDDKFY